MKLVYLLLCILGTVFPWSQFGPWVVDNGLNLHLLLDQAFSSRIAAFAWFDVLVSAIVVLTFVVAEGRRLGVRHLWAPFVAMFTVGVSLALPLFLLLREIRIAERSINGFSADAGNARAG